MKIFFQKKFNFIFIKFTSLNLKSLTLNGFLKYSEDIFFTKLYFCLCSKQIAAAYLYRDW